MIEGYGMWLKVDDVLASRMCCLQYWQKTHVWSHKLVTRIGLCILHISKEVSAHAYCGKMLVLFLRVGILSPKMQQKRKKLLPNEPVLLAERAQCSSAI